MRRSGILMPISSLYSNYGIGTLGKSAFKFVDFLEKAGQKMWQILPIGPTGYGDSPYQSVSSFAGNPYFIDIDLLIEEKLLTQEIAETFDFGNDKSKIDYEKLFLNRFNLLGIAENNFDKTNLDYCNFLKKNSFWLDDYSLFMAIKEKFNMVSFQEWDDDIRLRKSAVIKSLKIELSDRIEFYCVIQYFFYKQWDSLKKYANAKGVQIVGDIPIYVAPDSVELWSNPRLFQVDENFKPSKVAGCPPDCFSKDGQFWGNPLYDWDYHIETNFKWWKLRLKHCKKVYDVLRIDHFRGFESYYSIDANAKNARHGKWVQGPSYTFIDMLKNNFKNYPIIAEDLGFLTKEVENMLEYSGFPGMKILQFAFENGKDSDYLPHNYNRNCVVYTGTHDNPTTEQWKKSCNDKDYKFICKYINAKKGKDFTYSLIKSALSSVADSCIIPIQDYLKLENARINTPGVLGNNWDFRLSEKMLTEKLEKKIHDLTKIYFR